MNEDRAAQTTAGRSHARRLAWLAVAFIVGLATYNNLSKGIWIDEAFSFDTATGSLGRTFRQAIHFEMQPPLYFLLLNLMLRVWPSMEFGRFLSTACVVASVLVLYQLAKTLKLSGSAPSLPLLAALCPYVLWAGSEGRPYGLVLLLTTVATYLYVRLLTAEVDELPRLSVFYVITWYLSLLTFYYSGALLAGQVAGAVAARRRVGRVVAAATVVALLLLPWVPTIWMQVSGHPPGIQLEPGNELPVSGAGAYLHWAFQFAIHSIFMAPALRRPAVLAVVALALVAIAAGYWRARKTPVDPMPQVPVDPMLRVFAVTAVLPTAMLLTLAFAGLSLEPRYFGVAVVSVLGLMALAADRFPSRRVGRFLGISMMLFGALCVVGFQRNNRRVTDWEGAARFVSAREGSGEVIFVFEPEAVLPFQYYYRGSRPVFGLPVDRLGDVYSIERQAIHSIDQVAARVQAKAGPSGEFWVVARRPRTAWGRALLDEYLQHHAILLTQGPPGGIDVRRYRLPRSSRAVQARDLPDSATTETPVGPGVGR